MKTSNQFAFMLKLDYRMGIQGVLYLEASRLMLFNVGKTFESK